MGVAIDRKLEDDPLGRWGYRKVQEKLGLQGVHIPRYGVTLYSAIICFADLRNSHFVALYMRARDEAAAAARRPGAKLVHSRGLWSTGPNEEWGGDGHLKLHDEMGITIWGLVDKASRRELGLYAVPGPLNANVPVALYLLTVKKQKGKD